MGSCCLKSVHFVIKWWLLSNEVSMTAAQLNAANAHCTIAQHAAGNMTKKKTRGSTKKIKARFLTLPEMREAFETREREWSALEKQNADRLAEKAAEATARMAHINKDTVLKESFPQFFLILQPKG